MTIDLATERGGTGGEVPLVVLHGFTGSGAAMEPLVTYLRQTREVITVDLVGHGNSPAPAELAHYDMSAVVTQLWSALDAEVVDLFGYSMGGRVALSAAVTRPDRIRRLTLLGASAGLADPSERAARLKSDEALADSIEHDGLPTFVERWLALPLFGSLRALGPEWLAQTAAQRCSSDPLGLANSLRRTGTGAMPPLGEHLPGLSLPTLWLAGALDEKYCATGTRLAAIMPDASFESVESAGHAAHSERPEVVAHAIERFLAS